MAGNLTGPKDIYERLWREASAAFDRGSPVMDPFLKNRSADRRRSVTLIARPDSAVLGKIEALLKEISGVAPEQHFYQPAEIHLTVFSIIPGSASWQQSVPRMPDYMAVLEEVLKKRQKFSVAFRGVTASPEAVMVQGFPVGDALKNLRDDLRAEMLRRGIGENLDRRYRMTAAHLTIVRFSTPMADWKPLRNFLQSHCETDFGEICIGSLQLVESDWYASADSLRMIQEYSLS